MGSPSYFLFLCLLSPLASTLLTSVCVFQFSGVLESYCLLPLMCLPWFLAFLLCSSLGLCLFFWCRDSPYTPFCWSLKLGWLLQTLLIGLGFLPFSSLISWVDLDFLLLVSRTWDSTRGVSLGVISLPWLWSPVLSSFSGLYYYGSHGLCSVWLICELTLSHLCWFWGFCILCYRVYLSIQACSTFFYLTFLLIS